MSRANFTFSETSPAATGTAVSSQAVANAGSYFPAGVAGPMADYDAVDIVADLTGATGGTLDVYVQISPDDGLSWYDVVHFQQIAAGASVAYFQAPLSNATSTNVPVQVGKNLAPTLSGGFAGAAAVVNGAFSDRMRLVMVAGAGTTAGASVVVRVAPQRSESVRA